MKPMVHARNSARKFGGRPEDYLKIHDWFDSTKAHVADVRHRVILHNSFGCFLAEQVFGHTLVNSDGKVVHVRDVAEQHVLEDLGMIPSIERCLAGLAIQPWMAGGLRDASRREASKPQPVKACVEQMPSTEGVVVDNTPGSGPPVTLSDYIDGQGTRHLSTLATIPAGQFPPFTINPKKEYVD